MSDLIQKIIQYQTSRGGAHRAGTLSPSPLERIEWYFKSYFKDKPVRSVETGCGASSIVFSIYSEQHTAYSYDDRNEENSSVSFALEYPGFRKDRVKWVFGPTQRTIFSDPLDSDVDIVLIDGPHGYPFPELEYFAFYKRLKPGGILIVDDVHIPTINNFYKFLMQDESFRPHGLTWTTAYFQRTDMPSFNMEGDDWWLQRYNVQRFPACGDGEVNAGAMLPVQFVFDGKLNDAEPLLTRGFSLKNGSPVSEGRFSNIDVKIEPKTPQKVKLTFDVEPVCIEERLKHAPEVGFHLLVNTLMIATFRFENSKRQTIKVEAETDGADMLHIEFQHLGLLSGYDLLTWQKSPWFDARLPNFWLHSISIADAMEPTSAVNVLSRVDGSIMSFDYDGKRFSFLVDEFNDSVQSFHANGRFYELDGLQAMRTSAPQSASILDVGAHVGNHTVFFSSFLNAKRIVPIEPNRRAQASLRINCALNGASNVDLSFVDHALGAESAAGRVITEAGLNSGGTKVEPHSDGGVKIVCGDDIFPTESFDLIKIDVQGMEIDALKGLANLIARCHPILFVGVTKANTRSFLKQMDKFGYQICYKSQMYPELTNYKARHRSERRQRFLRFFHGR